MKDSNHVIGISPDNSSSAEIWSRKPFQPIRKEEKIFQRLTTEKKELQRKKSNIENRLLEIQNDLNARREQIRSGRL